MATQTSTATRGAFLAGGLVLLSGLLLWAFIWWTRPPQMGADEDVFNAVDALFTAVTARDEKLLKQCEQRLQALKQAGKLPEEASDYLAGIIRKARDGRWESSAEKLYSFMMEQRREGAADHPTQKTARGRPNPGKK